jgi:acetate kinase
MDTILVVNAGSSSVKFQIFGLNSGGGLTRQIKGQIDGIATNPRLRASGAEGVTLVDRNYSQVEVADVPAALSIVGAWLREDRAIEPIAIGHRVVHGGPDYDGPVVVDDRVIERLERYVSLAPLHQPHNLAPIRSIRARFPQLTQVACFDTAFHRGHAAVADHFAIPQHFYQEGVRRYGFHGLSYEYVADRLRTVAPEIAAGKVIVAHLGSGASMCALDNGRSVESTMGFTALDGLPMGTRPGQLDPGVLLYLIGEKRLDAAALERLLYRESGLKGLSGISNDMRELQANSDPRAQLAVDYFVYRAALCTGMLAAALAGLDAFVFTAGIGENSSVIRARMVEKIAWLGASLNADANAANALRISRPESRVAVLVVPTDEELMIARHTVAMLSASSRAARGRQKSA